MPWQISKRDGRYCVIKEGESKPVPGGCHDSRADAIKHQRALYASEPSMAADGGYMNVSVTASTSTAAATLSAVTDVPVNPPADWFDQPEPAGPQPLTFHPDGRVTGHLALWDQCHVGFLPECIRPSKGDDFGMFHTGAMETADGAQLPIGKVVFGTKHASTYDTPMAAAAQHYDDNGHVAAYVRASEGRHGIWLSGVRKNDLSQSELRDVRANPPSGDWRGAGGRLRLVAALAVPIPGYPIPQVAVAASGDVPTALIMQGYEGEEAVMAESVPRTKGYIRKKKAITAALEDSQIAAPLTAERRKALSARDFAVPETRSYPIYDEAHARNALARSSGKPEEGRVRRAVCRRYPNMGECGEQE